MGTLSRVVLCLLVLNVTGTAEAAIKLCLKNPVSAPIVDVPPNPRFVVERERLHRFSATDAHSGAALPYTVTPIDEYWVSVTVKVGAGTTVFSDDMVNWKCGGRRYRVVAKARGSHGATPITAATTRPGAGATYVIDLSWREPGVTTATRFDWAYDPADLDNGLYGSQHVRWGWLRSLAIDPRWGIVFVRVVQFHVDGKQSAWKGWVHVRPDGTAEVGTGSAPVTPPRSPACAATSPRTVPVDPVFTVTEGRFAAVTSTGVRLRVDIRPQSSGTQVAVRAPEGTIFQLQRLPAEPRCPTARWLHATTDRTRDEAPVVIAGDNGGCAVHVELADADTWGALEVTTPRATFANQHAADVRVTDIGGYDAAPMAVRITPVWNGVVGRPWSGWIQVEPRCTGIRFGAGAAPATTPAPTPSPPLPVIET
jgi:hypothetical protein